MIVKEVLAIKSIRCFAKMRNQYDKISKLFRAHKQPLHITANRRGDTVLLSTADFQPTQAESELLSILANAAEDVQNGRIAPIADTFNDIRHQLHIN